jgi:hypothetical protein
MPKVVLLPECQTVFADSQFPGDLHLPAKSGESHYERLRLLRPSRLLNGYRFYEQGAVKVLRFVRQAQTLGITLKEIKRLLELTHDGRRPCKAVRELAHQHLNSLRDLACSPRRPG